MALVLLKFFIGSILVAMGDACRGIFAAGHGFLAASHWNYLLAAVALTTLFLQAAFMAGGGLWLFKVSRGSRVSGHEANRRCRALASMVKEKWAARVILPGGSGGEAAAQAVGLFRPRILLSEGLVRALSGPQLKAVVAHEEAHCKGKDNLIVAVAKTLKLTLFYLPGPAMAFAEMRKYLEKAADWKAAEMSGGPLVVASALAKTASLTAVRPEPQYMSAVGRNVDLTARLQDLVTGKKVVSKRRRHSHVLFVAALVGVMMTFATSAQAAAGSDQRDALLCFTRHHIPPDGTCELEHSL